MAPLRLHVAVYPQVLERVAPPSKSRAGKLPLKLYNHIVAGDHDPLPGFARLVFETRHKSIVMARIVMEESETLGICLFAKADSLLPRRVSPADLGGKFLVGVGRVVNNEIGVLDKV